MVLWVFLPHCHRGAWTRNMKEFPVLITLRIISPQQEAYPFKLDEGASCTDVY